jgi:hypothetical protein
MKLETIEAALEYVRQAKVDASASRLYLSEADLRVLPSQVHGYWSDVIARDLNEATHVISEEKRKFRVCVRIPRCSDFPQMAPMGESAFVAFLKAASWVRAAEYTATFERNNAKRAAESAKID